MIGIRAFAIPLLLLLASTGAEGRDLVPADAVDPVRIRFMTAKAASSNCIGQARTPMCGIETVIDCVHYIRSSRCDRYDGADILAESKSVRVEYVIDKSGFVNPTQVRHVLRYSFIDEFLYFVYPDSYQARVLLRVCPDTRSSCAGVGWHDYLFTLNRADGDWTAYVLKSNFFEAYYLVD
jgi:hypothetical protein